MLDAQSSVEPAMAALAASRAAVGDWDRLEELVDQSERAVDQPDEFNQLALAFHNAVAEASRNRVLQATLASLGQVQSIQVPREVMPRLGDASRLEMGNMDSISRPDTCLPSCDGKRS
jgi:DNA-binding FadR family transcriptional regulator